VKDFLPAMAIVLVWFAIIGIGLLALALYWPIVQTTIAT
jgi:hypothetical protein